ncbi:MAG: ferritin [Bacteroidota bacterium]|nr:ferritin [Bacteroidota bacterium]
MLNKKITDLLNSQINKEFYSSYLYLDMSNYYIEKNLNGFGNWFAIQAQEEYAHAMLFIKYILNNSEKVVLNDIASPNKHYKDFKHPLEGSLEHEISISASINAIYAEAYTLKDFRTMQFLDWFVKEQGEEEKNVDDLCKRYEMFGTDPRGLYLLDAELATRVFNAPTLVI